MLTYRKPDIQDVELYFMWTNDELVREQSYNSHKINFEDHTKWFESKLKDENFFFFLFENDVKEAVGQIRIQKENTSEAIIGISIDHEHRGKGYAKDMLQISSDFFLDNNPNFTINAFIKESNLSSKYAFEKAYFEFKEKIEYKNFQSFHYIKIARI